MRTIGLIGAPTDVGAWVRGASLGPEALRVAGLAQALRWQGLGVQDWGDLYGPVNPMHPPVRGCSHLREVHIWTLLVAGAVQQALSWGQVPVLLGGDHSLAIGSVAAVARHCATQGKRLQLVWFDAHADSNTPATSPSGHLHGMPLACLLGQGPVELTRPEPVLRPEQVWLLGLRSTDPGEEALLQSVSIRPVRLQGGPDDGWQMVATLAQWLTDLDPQTHVHLSLDLDVLDPWAGARGVHACTGGPECRAGHGVHALAGAMRASGQRGPDGAEPGAGCESANGAAGGGPAHPAAGPTRSEHPEQCRSHQQVAQEFADGHVKRAGPQRHLQPARHRTQRIAHTR